MATMYCLDCNGTGSIPIPPFNIICSFCNGSGEVPESKDPKHTVSSLTPAAEHGGVNPKDVAGQCKVDETLIPDVALIHAAHAMMDGARKYGPYNWRDKKVKATVYVAAARRHIACWLEREEHAQDSGVRHLGHAIACFAILLDAQAHGALEDDRPTNQAGFHISQLFDDIRASVQGRISK